jgi:Protein of unknown function (DUF3800)
MSRATISVAELASYVSPRNGGIMALLGCYLDDSHDGLDREVFAVAGYYGWSLGFVHAENDWNECLDRHGLDYFKASECENVRGQFFKLRRDPRYTTMATQKEAASKIREEFITILNESVQIDGVGLGVPLEIYRKVLATEPEARIFLQDRHLYFGYHMLMIEMIKRLEPTHSGHWIGFVCDDHSRRDEAEAAYDELKEKNPKSAKMMGSMTHDDDEVIVPLQMADLLAYEVRRGTVETMKNGEIGKESLINQLGHSTWFVGYASEEYLREAIRDLVEQRTQRER